MTLTEGTRIGPYQIVGLIGAGAMGEVYRARDDRLGRDVAIKVTSEFERVVLMAPVPREGLDPDDVGTVVHVYRDGEAVEVEFTTLDGHFSCGFGVTTFVTTSMR